MICFMVERVVKATHLAWQIIEGKQLGWHGRFSAIIICLFVLLFGFGSLSFAGGEESKNQMYDINVPPLNAVDALNRLANQTGATFLFPYDVAKARQANQVVGRYSLMKALELLLDGSGLSASRSKKGVLRILLTKSDAASNQQENNMNNQKNRKSFLATAISLFFASSGGGVQAEEGSSDAGMKRSSRGGVLEEVVVTAQKREQALQDVSIAVSAWGGEALSKLGVTSSEDVARITAGVNVAATSGGQDSQFTIRGVTQTDFNDTIEPPNAVYVDEGYMPTVQGQRFGLFDIDRVEILKGPQGTLFGRNATGGLVHYISNKPTEEAEGFVDITYGSYDQVRFEGAASGSLTDNLQARVSGLYSRHDEYINNVYPAGNFTNPVTGNPAVGSASGADDLGNDNQWAGRLQLQWQINDDAELLVSVFGADEEIGTNGTYEHTATTAILDDNGNQINTIFSADDPQRCEAILASTGGCTNLDFVDGDFGDVLRPVQGGDLFGFVDPGGSGDQNVSQDFAVDDGNTYETQGTTINLNWDLGGVDLTSVTHYMKFEKEQALDGDLSPLNFFNVVNNNETDSFSQELRFSGETDEMRWIVGYFYLQIDNSNQIAISYGADSPITLQLGGTPIEIVSFVEWDRQSHSLFGQVDYDLSDQWTLIAGLRVIEEENDFEYFNETFVNVDDAKVDSTAANLIPGFPLNYPSFETVDSELLWSGKLVLEYRPNDDWMIYGGINRGTKAGGFNGKLNDTSPALPVEDIPYDEEVLVSYELGFKGTVFDGKGRLSGSVFYYDYTDYQGFVFSGSSGFVRNADATYVGAELELTMQVTENLEFLLNGAYLDAEIEYLEVADGVFRDVEPTFTPALSLNAIVRYTWPEIIANGDVTLQLDGSYMSERYNNIRNFDAHEYDDYSILNARLSWFSAEGDWEVSVFANNINDESYKTAAFDLSTFSGASEEAYGKPVWYGASVRYNW